MRYKITGTLFYTSQIVLIHSKVRYIKRMKTEKKLEKFLDLTNAARLYPLSRRTLQELIWKRKLPAFRAGNKTILKRDDLEKYLTSTPVGADLDRIVNEVTQDILGK